MFDRIIFKVIAPILLFIGLVILSYFYSNITKTDYFLLNVIILIPFYAMMQFVFFRMFNSTYGFDSEKNEWR